MNKPERLALQGVTTTNKRILGRSIPQTGVKNNSAKLDENQVQAIRKDPRKLREIAAEYGVSVALISRIKTFKLWTHI